MALTQRDTQHHTYGEYLTWSDGHREELIDGVAYVREPPAPSRTHQELELKGQTPLTAVPGVSIDWDRLLSQLV